MNVTALILDAGIASGRVAWPPVASAVIGVLIGRQNLDLAIDTCRRRFGLRWTPLKMLSASQGQRTD